MREREGEIAMYTVVDPVQTCGNCLHAKWEKTPNDRIKKHRAGECRGVVTLVAPMSYRVTLHKQWVWPRDDATKCVKWEKA